MKLNLKLFALVAGLLVPMVIIGAGAEDVPMTTTKKKVKKHHKKTKKTKKARDTRPMQTD